MALRELCILRNQRGQGLSEYIIIAILVAIIVIVGLRYFGGSMSKQFGTATEEIGSLDSGGSAGNTDGSGSIKKEGGSGGESSDLHNSGSTGHGGGSSTKKSGGDDLSKEVEKLKADAVGAKEDKPAEEIVISWRTMLWIAGIIIVSGIFFVLNLNKKDKKSKKKKPKKKLFSLGKRGSSDGGQSGQAMVEFLFCAITFLFVILGVLQLAMCLNAASLVRYAAYNAARAAIVHGGNKEKMLDAARLSLIATSPRHGRADHVRGFMENYLGAVATDHIPGMTYYTFKKGSITELEYITDVKILNNTGLAENEVVTFDDPAQADKGLITVEVTHMYEMVVPLVNRIIFYSYKLWRENGSVGNESLIRRSYVTNKLRRTGDFKDIEYRIPLVAHYTMRLQSDYKRESF